MPALIPSDGKNVWLYSYQPNAGAAYFFTAFMGIATIAHFGCMIRYRSWFFIPLIIGGTCEAFGYYGRSWSSREPKLVDAYVMQILLLMGAPPFIAATMYMTLTRITSAIRGEKSLRFITGTYVLIDVIAFISQMVGSGLQATNDAQIIDIGSKVVLGGLIFQLVALAAFLMIAIKMRSQLQKESAGILRRACKWYFWGLYVSVVALWIRSLVRAIEYAQPLDGTIITNEWFVYVFDAVPMFLILVLLLVPHAGWIIKREQHKDELPMRKDDREGMEVGLIGVQSSIQVS